MAAVQRPRHEVWRDVDTFAVPHHDPLLSDEEVGRIVDASARADCEGNPPDGYPIWRSLTTYQVGDVITPTKRHDTMPGSLDRYTILLTATVAGQSGSSEPAWPVSGSHVDGTVTWTVTGEAPWIPTYDVERAIYEAWVLKMGQAVEQYSFAAGSVRENSSDLLKHCQEMVNYWATHLTASPRLQGDTRRTDRRAENERIYIP